MAPSRLADSVGHGAGIVDHLDVEVGLFRHGVQRRLVRVQLGPQVGDDLKNDLVHVRGTDRGPGRGHGAHHDGGAADRIDRRYSGLCE
jgi:hypothetical protein